MEQTVASVKTPEVVPNADRNKQDDNKSSNSNNKASKKRKRDHHGEAYQNFSFAPIPSTGRPGTPHRYFAESYQVFRHNICNSTRSDHGEDYKTTTTTTTTIRKATDEHDDSACHMKMRVHKHANGLCVVTAGDDLVLSLSSLSSSKDTRLQLSSIEMKQTAAPATSTGNKRKQQSAMLRGKQKAWTDPGVVRPDDVLCTMQLTTDGDETRTISLPCAVWGSVLEVNPRLSVDLVQQDPLFAGYLAVILPTGPFPPRRDDADDKKPSE